MSLDCREIRVALPDTGGDVYRQHQLVWKAIGDVVRHGREFVYAMTSPHVALVRSEHLAQGQRCVLREGPMRVLVATARQTERGLVALGPEEALAMADALLARHGIRASSSNLHGQGNLRGSKLDKSSNRHHDIRIPVSDIGFEASFTNPALATLAVQRGIGRAKRFGCGMLRMTP